jgi:hypothetical protein
LCQQGGAGKTAGSTTDDQDSSGLLHAFSLRARICLNLRDPVVEISFPPWKPENNVLCLFSSSLYDSFNKDGRPNISALLFIPNVFYFKTINSKPPWFGDAFADSRKVKVKVDIYALASNSAIFLAIAA